MPTTSNFGWTTPADTDLVKNGALAIRTLGNGIDTSLLDLKGGTTGQILSKASNTDLDYTWINNDQGDITEVQAGTGISVASGTGPIPIVTNTVATAFDAKGDLVAGTGADTFAKLTVGADNTVLTADSTTATGLKWAAPATGGYTSLATGSMSGSEVSITSINNGYRDLVLIVRDFQTDVDAEMRFKVNATSNVYNTLDAEVKGTSRNLTAGTGLIQGGSFIDSADSNNFLLLRIYDYANTATIKFAESRTVSRNDGGSTYTIAANFYAINITSALSSIQLSVHPVSGSANWDGGTYELYGVK